MRIGDICEFVYGASLPKQNRIKGIVPVYGSNGQIDYHNKSITKDETIIVGRKGSIGEVHYSEIGCWVIDTAYYIKPLLKIDIKYLYHLLKTLKLSELNKASSIPGLNRDDVYNIDVNLPLLEEQNRIVKIIEKKLKAVEKAKSANNEQINNCNLLKDKLYEKIFEKYQKEQATIDSICDDISDGTHFTPTYVTHGIPFLSVKDLTKGYISFDNCRYIDIEEHKKLIKRCNPQYGDVLYTKVGTTGIAKAIDVKRDFSIFVSVALLKLKKNISPYFVEKSLNLSFCKKQADKLTQGATNKNLVIKDLKTIKLFCPEYSEQIKIVKVLEKYDKILSKLNISINECCSYINALHSSILRKAFNGEY